MMWNRPEPDLCHSYYPRAFIYHHLTAVLDDESMFGDRTERILVGSFGSGLRFGPGDVQMGTESVQHYIYHLCPNRCRYKPSENVGFYERGARMRFISAALTSLSINGYKTSICGFIQFKKL